MAYSASPIVTLVAGIGRNTGTSSAIDTTGADILFVAVSSYNGFSAPTLSDSKSNTWTALTAQTHSGNDGPRIQWFYCVAPTVGSGHTFTLTGSNFYGSIGVAAFSGAKATSPFDVEAGASTAGAGSLATGSVTPSEDNEIVISAIGLEEDTGTPSVDSGFTRIGGVNFSGGTYFGLSIGFLIQTTAGAVNPTWDYDGSHESAGRNATFKAAAGGGSGAMTAALTGGGTSAGTLTGSGALAAATTGTGALAGTLTGSGAAAAGLTGSGTLDGALAGTGALASALTGTGALTGTFSGTTSIAADLSGSGAIAGTLTGAGAIAADLGGSGAITATLVGERTVAFTGTADLSGTLTGAGAMAAALTGTGTLGASILGGPQNYSFPLLMVRIDGRSPKVARVGGASTRIRRITS